MKKKGPEKRSFSFSVRAEHSEEQGYYLSGRPIVYEKKTDIGGMFEERICAGALDHANLDDVRFLINHDISKIPLARSQKGNPDSTMQLTTDTKGLSIRVNLDIENNTEARALYSAVQRGDISGMSFMFGIKKERWEGLESDYPKRYIEAISTVTEVSAVTFPAYKDTDITARNKETLENARNAVNAARSGGDDSDDGGLPDKELLLLKEKNKNLGGF